MKKQKGSQPVRQSKRGPRRDGLIPHPPPVEDIGLRREVRVRMLCNAAFANDVTFQNLLDIFNSVTVSGTQAADLFTAVKVKKVEAWANGLTNASAIVSLIFDGATLGAQGDQKLHTDSSMGIEPAHIVAVPTRQSQCAQFQASSANKAFYLNCPAGTVVDLMLSLRNPLAGAAVITQNPPAAGTAGTLYMRGMDGVAVATSKFTPVGALAID